MDYGNAQKEMTLGQLREFHIRVLAALPLDMGWERTQRWIQNPKALSKVLSQALISETDIKSMLTDWQRFYQKFFGIKNDFFGVKILETQPDFDRLILVVKDFTPNQVFEVCQKNFSCWRYTENLDKATKGRNDRETTQDYAIWVRDRQEADKELKNMSVDTLKEKNIKGITLLERLIFELKFWDETGKHLDEENITLCAGSRYSGGVVPGARWCAGWFRVDWYRPQGAIPDLRARAVVSF